MDATTENVTAGATEVWQIANLSADTHPIHFHLVNAQVISRQAFAGYRNGVPNLQGAPLPPPPFERGWKETVRMNPGEVTTVIMRFDLPQVPFNVPLSPRTGGHEYVWHCHILEHEEHDMMRPLIVI
jgi:spore coat protein A, manganese oxidase